MKQVLQRFKLDFCSTNGISDISYSFKVTNVFPLKGSILGGSEVTITGLGFSSNMTDNMVTVGGTTCEITSADSTAITCHLNSPVQTHRVDNSGVDPSESRLSLLSILLSIS